MNLHELLVSRRTVHDYKPDHIPSGALERALQAAVSAPNHRMTEPWQFLDVGAETRKQLLKIAVDLKTKPDSPLTETSKKRLCDKVLLPPHLLVAVQHLHEKPKIAEEDYASLACAIENLMLSLAAEGVGSKWSTGGVTSHERTYSLLGVDQSSDRIVGFVWLGYSSQPDIAKPRRRRDLADVWKRLP